ncbi:MAG: endolytic transglycosylase MltG [Actinomycetota bacterium]
MTLTDEGATRQRWQADPWDPVDQIDADVVEPVRRSRRWVKWIMVVVATATVVAILVAGSVGWWYVHQINPSGQPGAPVNFVVNKGETLESLSLRLHDDGIILNSAVFRWYAKHQGGLELTPGFYALRPHDRMGNILRALSTPPDQTYTSVTFPEGLTVSKMAARLAAKVPRLSIADFMDATNNGSVHSALLPDGGTNLEGLLFPDTYQVSNGESAEHVVGRMAALMERVGRQENIVTNGYVQGLTAYQVLIVASMVEREAKVDADRPLIARVILNRIRRQMPLQIDATLFYGQDSTLPFDQLRQIDTPYNTYMHEGLPPTPIANPGRASIRAVLHPAANPPLGGPLCQKLPKADCEYLYYVIADADGRHVFAVTGEQHQANVDKARAAGLL